MDKESIIALQNIDCNCNDCKFMVRDNTKFKESLDTHYRWEMNYFNTIRNNLYRKALKWRDWGELEKYESVSQEGDKMKFQFNKKEVTINYGDCIKFNKEVTFIPNICQLDTQECFKHRRG